jgi:hypothetical protein
LGKRYAEKFGVCKPLKEVEREYFAGDAQAVEFMPILPAFSARRWWGFEIHLRPA